MSEELSYRDRLALIRNGMAEKTTKAKPKKPLKKISEKKQKEMKEQKASGDDSELVKFYRSCMKRMAGYCRECNRKTETHVYSGAIFSICHILDKRETMCPSVETNPFNWIELCPSCHQQFDSTPLEQNKTLWDKREAMGCWPIVRDKLIMVYQELAIEERRHFPQSVLDYMEKHQPF